MRASLALALVALAFVSLIENVGSLKAVRLSSMRNGREDERPIALQTVLDDETRIPNVRRRKALAAPRRRAFGWSDSDNVNDDEDDDEDGVDLEADAGTGDLRDQNTVLEDYSQQPAATQPAQTTQAVLPSMDSLGLGAAAKKDEDSEGAPGGGIDNSNLIGGVDSSNEATATVEDTEETVGLATDGQGAGGAGAATGGSSLFNIAEEGEGSSAGAETGAVDGVVQPQQPQQQVGGGLAQQGQVQPSQAQAGVAWGLNNGAGAGGGVQDQGTGTVTQGGFVQPQQQQQPAGGFVQQQQPAGGFVGQQQPTGGFVQPQQQQQATGGFVGQQQPAGGFVQQQQPTGGFVGQQQPTGGFVQPQQQQQPTGGFVGQQGQPQQTTGGFIGQQGQAQQTQPNGAGGLVNGGGGGQVQDDDNGPVGLGGFVQPGAQQGAQQPTQTGFGAQQQQPQTIPDPTQQGQADGLGFGDQQAVGFTDPQAGGQGAGQQQEGEGGVGLGEEQLGPNLRVSEDSEGQAQQAQPGADTASSEASLFDSTGGVDTTYNTSGDTASLVDQPSNGEEAGGQLWNRQENDGGAGQTVQLQDEASGTGAGGVAVSDFQGTAAAQNETQTRPQQQQWGQGLRDGQPSQGQAQGQAQGQGQPDDSMLGLGGLGTQPGSVGTAGEDGALSQLPQQQAEPQPRVQVGGPDDSVIGIGGGGAIDATADPGTVATLNGDTGAGAASWGGEASDPAIPIGTGQIGSATDVTGPAGPDVPVTIDAGLGSGTAAGVDGLTQPGSLTGINAEDVEAKLVEDDTVDLSSTGGAILSSTDHATHVGAGNGQGQGIGGGGGIGGGVRPHGAGQGAVGGWGHGAGHGGHGQGGVAGGVGPRAGAGAGHPRGAGTGAGAGIGFGGGAGAGSNLGHTDPIGSDPSVVGHASDGGAGVAGGARDDVGLEDVRQEQDAWTRGAGSQSQQAGALAAEPQKVNNVVTDAGFIATGASGPLEVGSTRLFDSAQAIETIQAIKMPSGSLGLSFNILTIMTIATLGGGGVLCCCRKRSGAPGSRGWHSASPRDATRGFTPRNNILPVTKGDLPKEAPHSGRRQVKEWGEAPHSSKRGIKDSWGGTDWSANETTWDASKAVGQRSGSKTPGRDPQMVIRDLEGAWDGGWDDTTPSPVGSARTPGGVGRAQMQVSAAAMVQRSGHSGTMEAMSPRHKKAVMAMAQQAVAASAAAAAAAGGAAGEREPSKKQIKLAKD